MTRWVTRRCRGAGRQGHLKGRPFAVAYRVFQGRELTTSPQELERWTQVLLSMDTAGVPAVVPLSSTCIGDKSSLAP